MIISGSIDLLAGIPSFSSTHFIPFYLFPSLYFCITEIPGFIHISLSFLDSPTYELILEMMDERAIWVGLGQRQHGSARFSGGKEEEVEIEMSGRGAHAYTISDTGVMCPDRKVG
jgi:hypothetical protein